MRKVDTTVDYVTCSIWEKNSSLPFYAFRRVIGINCMLPSQLLLTFNVRLPLQVLAAFVV